MEISYNEHLTEFETKMKDLSTHLDEELSHNQELSQEICQLKIQLDNIREEKQQNEKNYNDQIFSLKSELENEKEKIEEQHRNMTNTYEKEIEKYEEEINNQNTILNNNKEEITSLCAKITEITKEKESVEDRKSVV